jgi:hypothetical protein
MPMLSSCRLEVHFGLRRQSEAATPLWLRSWKTTAEDFNRALPLYREAKAAIMSPQSKVA